MVELNNLRRITYELATEVESGTEGPTFNIVTFILDQINSPAMILDDDLEVIYQNEAMTGWLDQDYAGRKCFSALDRESPCSDCDALKSLRTKKVIHGENTLSSDNRKVTIPLVFNGVSGAMILFEVSRDER